MVQYLRERGWTNGTVPERARLNTWYSTWESKAEHVVQYLREPDWTCGIVPERARLNMGYSTWEGQAELDGSSQKKKEADFHVPSN